MDRPSPPTVLIVDDEPLARLRLRQLLGELPESRNWQVQEAEDGIRALQQAHEHQPKLAFLDVEMPGLSGLELAEALRKQVTGCAFVFVTAYVEHAFTAYQLGAADYLGKPVTRKRLEECLQRLRPLLLSASPAPDLEPQADHLLVSSHDGLRSIPLASILYFQADMKYVTARTATTEYILSEALNHLESQLQPVFVRTHRSYLVRISSIARLRRNHACEEAGGWSIDLREPGLPSLPVSRRQLAHVRATLARGAMADRR